MTKCPSWLLEFKNDVYSQAGEDGVVGKILEVLPSNDKWCVEFGAWDGVFASNSRNLIQGAGYAAVLIEPDGKKFKELRANYANNDKVIPVNAFVGFNKHDGLDALLAEHAIPRDFDFLSIDVDGNDYHIWKAVQKFRPKVICVEFNPTIPTAVDFVQPADPKISQGASLSALVALGKEKGYELVSVVSHNAFLVAEEYFPLFEIEDNRPETLRKDLDVITYLFSGYDGTVFLSGYKGLPWHMLPIKERSIQVLPRFLRKHPGRYSLLAKISYAPILGFSSPKLLMRQLRARLPGRNT